MSENIDRLVRDVKIPHGWERVIGEAAEDDMVTTFTSAGSWFDVTIYPNGKGQYNIEVKRGPSHERQDEIDEPLREQVGVDATNVEFVAVGFMVCAADMDPFTNKFTRGHHITK